MAINPNSNPEAQEEEWEILPYEQGENNAATPASEDEDEDENPPNATSAENFLEGVAVGIPEENRDPLLPAEEEVNNHSSESAENSERGTSDDEQQETEPLLSDDQANQNNNNTQETQPDTHVLDREPEAGLPEEVPSPEPDTTPPRTPETPMGFLGSSLRLLEDAVKDLDERHHIRRKTRNSLKTISNESQRGLQKIGESTIQATQKIQKSLKTISNESQRGLQKIGESTIQATQEMQKEVDRLHIDEKAKAVETQAKIAAGKLKEAAKTAGDKAKAFNEEHKVTEVLAAAAMVGAGLLLARGNGRVGATVLASGGAAAYMAGEAMRSPYRHDPDLNENIGHHL